MFGVVTPSVELQPFGLFDPGAGIEQLMINWVGLAAIAE
jgi:hypothetical protein